MESAILYIHALYDSSLVVAVFVFYDNSCCHDSSTQSVSTVLLPLNAVGWGCCNASPRARQEASSRRACCSSGTPGQSSRACQACCSTPAAATSATGRCCAGMPARRAAMAAAPAPAVTSPAGSPAATRPLAAANSAASRALCVQSHAAGSAPTRAAAACLVARLATGERPCWPDQLWCGQQRVHQAVQGLN
jgi:hypothetical protein